MKIGALVAVAAFLLLAVVAGGAIAIWLGMDYGLAAGDGEAPAVAGTSEAKVETPKAADPPAAVPDKVAPKPVPVEVAVTAPPGVEIHRDGKLIGTGTATVTFDSDKAAPVDLAFKGEDWTPKTLSVGPDKKSVAVELTPKPEPAAAANRPKRVKRPKRTTLPKKTSAKPVNVKAPVKADPPPKKKKAKKMGFVE